ncbi:MAG: hypothetical protein IJ371_02360 [Clostridia bacterium]|nr:hypothetical protein [Clostridia bacterium]
METKTIRQYLISSNQAQVIIDNDYYEVDYTDELNSVLNIVLQDSHALPAFGVSIHTETLKAIQKGVWLKLQYNGTQYVNGKSFDELLIEVQPNFCGFNIIRGNKGVYEGRCFYIDLIDNTMKPIYYLINEKR